MVNATAPSHPRLLHVGIVPNRIRLLGEAGPTSALPHAFTRQGYSPSAGGRGAGAVRLSKARTRQTISLKLKGLVT